MQRSISSLMRLPGSSLNCPCLALPGKQPDSILRGQSDQPMILFDSCPCFGFKLCLIEPASNLVIRILSRRFDIFNRQSDLGDHRDLITGFLHKFPMYGIHFGLARIHPAARQKVSVAGLNDSDLFLVVFNDSIGAWAVNILNSFEFIAEFWNGCFIYFSGSHLLEG